MVHKRELFVICNERVHTLGIRRKTFDRSVKNLSISEAEGLLKGGFHDFHQTALVRIINSGK